LEDFAMGMIGNLLPITSLDLLRLKETPESLPEFQSRSDVVDVDKMWEALHFLLTGQAFGGTPPLSNALLGGTEIGPDRGYGPVRFLTPDEVQEVATALQGISHVELRSRFNPTDLERNEIYSMNWDEPVDELFDDLRSHFDLVTACYRDAAAKHNAMLLWIG
jgi:hypothetical protein